MGKRKYLGRSIFAAALAVAVPASAAERGAEPAALDAAAPIDPARLAAAEAVADRLVPVGTYQRIMADIADTMAKSLIATMMGLTPDQMGVPVADGQDGSKSLGASMAAADPAFAERGEIMMRVIFSEMAPLMTELEPAVRAALARTLARRFDLPVLTDLAAFFATPSGSAFGAQFMGLFTDREMLEASMAMTPKLLEAMPAIMKKVEEATAHLPPPPARRDAQPGPDTEAQPGDAPLIS